ncbi:MAG TPA: hypothetical protein ENK19_11960, partial [Acidobacteria bacterium]|nr:hypothetical protein [Acidobacteriota bacterium]
MEVSVPEAGTLRATTDDGRPLEIEQPGRGWSRRIEEAPGNYDLRLRLPAHAPAVTEAALFLEPRRLAATTPLPALPDAEHPPLPDFPVVGRDAPRFFDLGFQEKTTLAVHAAEDALYRLESTGLLDTSGTLRSRTVVRLARSSSHGSGRNFLLQRYLRRGDYQLVVATHGRSYGHLGVRLERSPLADGGVLRPGIPARTRVPGGGGLLYRFHIERSGRYTITAMRRGGLLNCRLEDGDGWPVIAPGARADLNLELDPGDYRLVVLPTPAGGRRVTTLRRISEPPRFSGHGPHRLPLGRPVANLWTEPPNGERPPDRWRFTLPAPCPVEVRLDAGMEGRISRLDGGGEEVVVPPHRGWRGTLEAGRYQLAVRSHRRNNRVPYHLEVRPRVLVAGTERRLTAPATVPVAIAGGRLVEIASTGAEDVSARLLDASGRQVAQSDDRPGDWSFLISGRFPDGEYTLRVSPVGAARAATTVAMVERPGHDGPALTIGASRRLHLDGAAVETLPLAAPPAGTVLAVTAEGSQRLGLAVDGGDGWRTLGEDRGDHPQVLIPGVPDGRYRVRVWSVDGGGDVRLAARALTPTRVGERRLARGVTAKADPAGPSATAVLEVRLDGPGAFELPSGPARLLASAAAGTAMAPVTRAVVVARTSTLWLA